MAWLKDDDGRRSGIGDWRSADHDGLRICDALACPVLAGSTVETGSRDGAGFEHAARVAVSTMPAQQSRSRVNSRTTY